MKACKLFWSDLTLSENSKFIETYPSALPSGEGSLPPCHPHSGKHRGAFPKMGHAFLKILALQALIISCSDVSNASPNV